MKYLWMTCCLLCAVNVAGQVIVNSDGSHSIVSGNVIVHSDGTHSVKSGDVIINSNGSHSIISGNVIVNSDGSHAVKSGNVIVNSDGSHTIISGNDPVGANKSNSAVWHNQSQSAGTNENDANLTVTYENYPIPVQAESGFADQTITLSATQEAFWNELLNHCGKAYAGKLEAVPAPADFAGKELKMYVMSCDDNMIKIPFYVGEDRSRTWVLTKAAGGILLKHDHRLNDGSEDEITMYGGLTSNGGSANAQYFPADQETTDLIPDASANLWWITVDNTHFSYNLRRVTTPNLFSVVFDLENPVEIPELPWGHEQ